MIFCVCKLLLLSDVEFTVSEQTTVTLGLEPQSVEIEQKASENVEEKSVEVSQPNECEHTGVKDMDVTIEGKSVSTEVESNTVEIEPTVPETTDIVNENIDEDITNIASVNIGKPEMPIIMVEDDTGKGAVQ